MSRHFHPTLLEVPNSVLPVLNDIVGAFCEKTGYGILRQPRSGWQSVTPATRGRRRGFTSDTHQTEWNLVHHLSNEIHGRFPDFDCDVDLVKPTLQNKRPDIVIHRRGTHELNFLAIEVKLNGTPSGLEQDIRKIKTYWMGKGLHYEFGAVIDLRKDMTFSVVVVSNVD